MDQQQLTYLGIGAAILIFLYKQGFFDRFLSKPSVKEQASQTFELVHRVESLPAASPAPPDTTQKLTVSLPIDITVTPKPPEAK